MRFGIYSKPLIVQLRDNFFPGFEAVQTLILGRSALVYFSIQRENAERDELVPLAYLIVVEIVRRSYFDQPVPNAGSTKASAITGMRRSHMGSRTGRRPDGGNARHLDARRRPHRQALFPDGWWRR